MGDHLGSFLRERASEDKARWKDSYWFVGTVGQIWDVTLTLTTNSKWSLEGPVVALLAHLLCTILSS